jgi:DNA-binding NarL/FixJ family response regulator
MDITLPGTSGIEAMRRMLLVKPDTRVLMFSMHEETIFARRALQAGAFGYVTKASAPSVLVEAVH